MVTTHEALICCHDPEGDHVAAGQNEDWQKTSANTFFKRTANDTYNDTYTPMTLHCLCSRIP